jgi:predicted RNase H-like HicB family nuclease
MRQVVIYPGEDGQWVAECPSLPGCVTQGHTREEAVANAREAISEYIAALEEDSSPFPASHRHARGSQRISMIVAEVGGWVPY